MTENVLQFPKSKIVREVVLDSDELTKMKEKSKLNLADSIVEDMSERMLYEMSDIGIDTAGDHFIKDFHFLTGVLAAAVYRTLGIDHPLHSFIDENVEMVPIGVFIDGEEVILTRSDLLEDENGLDLRD